MRDLNSGGGGGDDEDAGAVLFGDLDNGYTLSYTFKCVLSPIRKILKLNLRRLDCETQKRAASSGYTRSSS